MPCLGYSTVYQWTALSVSVISASTLFGIFSLLCFTAERTARRALPFPSLPFPSSLFPLCLFDHLGRIQIQLCLCTALPRPRCLWAFPWPLWSKHIWPYYGLFNLLLLLLMPLLLFLLLLLLLHWSHEISFECIRHKSVLPNCCADTDTYLMDRFDRGNESRCDSGREIYKRVFCRRVFPCFNLTVYSEFFGTLLSRFPYLFLCPLASCQSSTSVKQKQKTEIKN